MAEKPAAPGRAGLPRCFGAKLPSADVVSPPSSASPSGAYYGRARALLSYYPC